MELHGRTQFKEAASSLGTNTEHKFSISCDCLALESHELNKTA